MLTRIGLSSALALASASSPHGYQSTGLSLCCSRYGLVSFASRFATGCSLSLPRGMGVGPVRLGTHAGCRPDIASRVVERVPYVVGNESRHTAVYGVVT